MPWAKRLGGYSREGSSRNAPVEMRLAQLDLEWMLGQARMSCWMAAMAMAVDESALALLALTDAVKCLQLGREIWRKPGSLN